MVGNATQFLFLSNVVKKLVERRTECTEKGERLFRKMTDFVLLCNFLHVQGGARNVIPLIVHITHFYYYKSI